MSESTREEGQKGYVEVQLLGGEDITESMMKQSLEIATELTAMGVPANKIAILVRSNKAIQDIAAYLWRIQISDGLR